LKPAILLAILLIIGAIVLIAAFFLSESALPEHNIDIGGITLIVELADTRESREQGLSGRSELGEDRGLLMAFDQDGSPQIWMKDMLFPLDIIWIGSNGTVVTLKEAVEPCGDACIVFYPTRPAKYVLEVNAGFCESHGLEEGDHAVLRL
jgi:uncharacterized protein